MVGNVIEQIEQIIIKSNKFPSMNFEFEKQNKWHDNWILFVIFRFCLDKWDKQLYWHNSTYRVIFMLFPPLSLSFSGMCVNNL